MKYSNKNIKADAITALTNKYKVNAIRLGKRLLSKLFD